MTLYEYRCQECDRRSLVSYSLGKAPQTRDCDYDCTGTMDKMLSRGTFVTVPGAHDDTYGVRKA